MLRILFLAVISLASISVQLNAAIVTVPATDAGYYLSFLGTDLHLRNGLIVGWQLDAKSYAIFDMSSVGGISAATLRINSGQDAGRNHPATIDFRSYLGHPSELDDGSADQSTLADGILFASETYSQNFPYLTTVDVPLNRNAVLAINDSSDLFAIAISQADRPPTSGMFADVPISEIPLVVTTVPESSSLALLALVLGFPILKRRMTMLHLSVSLAEH